MWMKTDRGPQAAPRCVRKPQPDARWGGLAGLALTVGLLAACATPADPPAAPAAALRTDVQAHLGQYPQDGRDFLRQGPLAQRLQALLGPRYTEFLLNMGVSSPLQQEGGLYYISGNRPHRGGDTGAAVVVDPAADVVWVWLLSQGRAQQFVDPGRPAPQPLPLDIRTLLSNSLGNGGAKR